MAVEIDPHAEIEILLGAGADHGSEMEHGDIVAVDQGGHRGAIGNIARDHGDACIEPLGRARRHRHIEQRHRIDRLGLARRTSQRSQLDDPLRQPQTQKSGATGDDDLHGLSPDHFVPC